MVLTQNQSAGIIMSTQSLVLQKIGRDNAGNYTCLASNDRGETTSPIVTLRVQCKYKIINIVIDKLINNLTIHVYSIYFN